MAEDEQQAAAQAANPNIMNVNELKTLFSNPKATSQFFMGTIQSTQSQQNVCSIKSRLLKQPTTGQTQLQSVILNLSLEERQLTGCLSGGPSKTLVTVVIHFCCTPLLFSWPSLESR